MGEHEFSANERVINYILDKIRNREFVEGYKIPTEAELSEMLGVSRGSVREALKTLQFLDLLKSTRGSGYRLTDSFEKSLCKVIQFLFEMIHYSYKDISDIREGLELKALLNIQKNGVSPSDIAELKECIKHMERGEFPHEYDLRFHLKLAELSHNNLIYNVTLALSKVSENYILIPWENLTLDERLKLIDSHKEIVEWLTMSTEIIEKNPISNHYRLADNIIKRTKSIEGEAFIGYQTINDLINSGLSDEEIYGVIKDLKNKQNK